jgi:glycosyltransferase involved in cell wall biosynthesis
MYFSYDEPWSAQAKDAGDQRCRDTINVSAYLGQKFNERGILWFLNSIWPAIRNEFPHLRLVVTGANPPASIVQATGRAGGEMKVRPSPLEMNHVYARSLLSVAPTLDGSGIKVRVAESLRRGVPVLSTQHCAVGYDKISRSVLKLFADAGQAVAGVRDIVGGDRVQLGEACITEWEREFSLAQGVRKLREVHEWLATR